MGYRSQVCIGFKKEAFLKNVGKNIEDFKDCDTVKETESSVVFIWDDVKWYPDYEDVKSVEEVINRVAEASKNGDDYGFLRVGEETKDIESKGSPYEFGLYACTTITTDESGDEVPKEEFFAPNAIKFIKE